MLKDSVWTKGLCHVGRRRIVVALALSLGSSAYAQDVSILDKAVNVDVSRQQVSTALIELSKEAGIQMLMPGRYLDKFQTQGVRGHMSLRDALIQILQGTKYRFHQVGENTIGIDAPETPPASTTTTADIDSPAFTGVIQLSEIYVVAQAENSYVATVSNGVSRMDNDLLTTPQSVSVITRKLMDDQQAQTLADAVTNASGVQVNQTQQGPLFGVRGMGPATIMNNGVVNNSQGATDTPIWAVDSIEVLKGPEAILAGSTTGFGGAINIINKQPQVTPTAALNVGTGSYGLAQLGVDLAGPLTKDKSLTYRLVAEGDRSGTNGAGYDSTHSYYVAPSLRWTNGSTSLLVGLERNVNNSPVLPWTVAPNGRLGKTESPIRVLGSTDVPLSQNETRVYYQFEQPLFSSEWSLRSSGSYDDQKFRYDGWQAAALLPPEEDGYVGMEAFNLNITTKSISDQIDLTGKFSTGPVAHQLRAGIDYNYVRLSDQFGFPDFFELFNIYSSPPLPPVKTLPPSPFIPIVEARLSSREIGYVVQDQLTLGDDWHALIGLRNAHYQVSGAGSGGSSNKTQVWLPNFGLVYSITPEISAYASATKGYRSNFADLMESGQVVPPTKSQQYEAGLKFYTSDKKFSLTTAVFQIKNNNTPLPIGATGLFLNGPGQKSKGFEVDVNGHILPGLDLSSSYAHTIPVNLDHSPVLNIARNSFSFWAGYRFQNDPLKDWSLGLRLLARSAANNEVGYLPYPYDTFKNPGNLTTDMHLGYTAKTWSINFGVKNVFDRRIYSVAGNDLYVPLDSLGRTYAITAKVNF